MVFRKNAPVIGTNRGYRLKTRFRLTLLSLLLLAALLRLYHLDTQSLWYDEGVTARVSQMGVSELTFWTANDIQPPLYYLLLNSWLRLLDPWPGNIAYLMRFISASFGLLLVPVLGIMARKLWDDCAGLLVAMVVAVSPLMVYYSQEARMYAMLIFLVSLSAWWIVLLLAHSSHRTGALQQDAEKKRLLFLGLYTLTGLAAMYTHYFAGFALLALALYWAHVWIRENKNYRALVGFVLANGLILIGYLPWLPAMLQRFRVDSSYWTGVLKIDEALFHTVDNFTVGATEVFQETMALRWLPWFGGAVILWITGLILSRRREDQRPLALVLHWLLLPPLMILFLAWRTPKFNPRYLLMSWPAWALLVGGGAATLLHPQRWLGFRSNWLRYATRTLGIITLLLVTTASAIGLDNWYNDSHFAKSAWREAITYMFHQHHEDEAVLLVSGHAYPVFDAYLPLDAPRQWRVPRFRLPEIDVLDVNHILGWQESAHALNGNLTGYGGVWLFLWQDDVVDPAHVVTIQLERYGDEQPVPSFAFLGLRHFRLPPDFHVPEQPPIALAGQPFASGLELVGVEPKDHGLWLYWRANRADLPDIKVALSLQKDKKLLVDINQRPVGYHFPTTRWNLGDIYPVWVPAPEPPDGARLQIHVYLAKDNAVSLGDFTVVLPVTKQASQH